MIKLKQSVAGVDEVGRGCLAGPVCSAAVILNPKFDYSFLNDSKKLTVSKRKHYNDIIIKTSESVGIGISSPKEIDVLNIRKATFLSMERALLNLNKTPSIALIDGKDFNSRQFNYKCIIRGDSSVPEIMAASIVAKVFRDNLMKYYSIVFPEYGFDKHKGYGTKMHFDSLKHHLSTVIHRLTFRPVYNHLSINNKSIKTSNEMVGVSLIESNHKIISFHKIEVDSLVLYLYVTFKIDFKILICNYINLNVSKGSEKAIIQIIKFENRILNHNDFKNINIVKIEYISAFWDNDNFILKFKNKILQGI